MKARLGFTLVETTIATAVAVLVMASLASFFVGVPRLVKGAGYAAKASLDLRAEREHLLFHAYHEGGNAYWAGALSAWHKIAATEGTESTDGSDGGTTGSLRFDVMGLDTSSLRPRYGERTVVYPRADFVQCAAPVVGEPLGDLGKTQKGIGLPILVPVALSRTMGSPDVADALSETFAVRVVIPVFGAEQKWNQLKPENVFFDEEVNGKEGDE